MTKILEWLVDLQPELTVITTMLKAECSGLVICFYIIFIRKSLFNTLLIFFFIGINTSYTVQTTPRRITMEQLFATAADIVCYCCYCCNCRSYVVVGVMTNRIIYILSWYCGERVISYYSTGGQYA